MGGENRRWQREHRVGVGSSPRGRGKRTEPAGQLLQRGLIPAWAGKTDPARPRGRSRTAHPRVGGENAPQSAKAAGRRGSSPRGRGKRSHDHRLPPPLRLIPAWAGKTKTWFIERMARGAHPRVGGENLTGRQGLGKTWGSSPRGRGKLDAEGQAALRGRLIPAWAGKTCVRRRAAWPTTAHPRVGGENRFFGTLPPNFDGSSPRGRGKPLVALSAGDTSGLIPAWAGKTSRRPASRPRSGAHPRVGGENLGELTGLQRRDGSSPRGRGKLRAGRVEGHLERLIPAWAGKTFLGDGGGDTAPAHPRVGGENVAEAPKDGIRSGSSPRGRGKRGRADH